MSFNSTASSFYDQGWQDFWDIPLFWGEFADFQDLDDLYNLIMCFICVVSAGLAAGLTMGLLSLDITKLEIKAMIGTDEEKEAVLKIIPIVQKHHLLLVTLLLFNSLANESLPVFLGSLVPNYIAILISVTLILIFGEILPSAFFTGSSQLKMAAKMTPFVSGLMYFFYPIAFPLSCLLDRAFGVSENDSTMNRDELEALVLLQNDNNKISSRSSNLNSLYQLVDNSLSTLDNNIKIVGGKHNTNNSNHEDNNIHNGKGRTKSGSISKPVIVPINSGNTSSSLSNVEIKMLSGILRLNKSSVADAMIPINCAFMLSDSTILDKTNLEKIWLSGFSRIPIYKSKDRHHILGFLLTKALIVVNPEDKISIKTLQRREPIFVRSSLPLLDMLDLFKASRCHLALVSIEPVQSLSLMSTERNLFGDKIVGIITLEDVIEKILQEDIIDETDDNSSAYMLSSSGKIKANKIASTTLEYIHIGAGASSGRTR